MMTMWVGRMLLQRRRGAFRFSGSLVIVSVCILSGCGGKDSHDLVPVSGRVTLEGQPLSDVRVNFQPAVGSAGPGSSGVTDASGQYVLSVMGESGAAGAVPGEHVVTISTTSHEEADDDAAPARDRSLPPRAGDGSLTFEVPPDGTDQADFELR